MAVVPITMRAFCVGNSGGVLLNDYPVPVPRKDEALIRVLRAGICNTDLELLNGYKGGYRGVLGHEFVGEVVQCPESSEIVGRRVCGELNVSCGSCNVCGGGGSRARNHCPERRVLGIIAWDGVFADYCILPVRNLHFVPENIPTELATFAEPLAAACRIVEQGIVQPHDRTCVVGDGKLGLLVAEVLSKQNLQHRVVLIGRHAHRANLVSDTCVYELASELRAELHSSFDVVVDATGNTDGLKTAVALTVPMGTIVLKSTCALPHTIDMSAFVVKELSVIGSRCGPFPESMKLLGPGGINVNKFLAAVYPLERVAEAIEKSRSKGCLKVQIAIADSELQHVDVNTGESLDASNKIET